MQIFETLDAWRHCRQSMLPGKNIGFVPTMGNLHKGHLSLLQQSKADNDLTVSSLFINPTQFNNPDDFKHYPRTLEADLALLEKAGVDYCLLPTRDALYPDNYHYQIHEQDYSHTLEGTCRPGHFTGVLTVVMKLLNLVQPHQAYFGEKDYQQYALIKGMAEAFFLPVAIRVCPTIRESDGLAYSSRNNRLSAEARQQAGQFARIFLQDKPCELLREELMAQGIQVEYLKELDGRKYVAVNIGGVRLIDNVLI